MDAKLVRIRGRVHGVGYRDWMVREATRLGVQGWVRNRSDGSVEALVCGEAAAVGALLTACRAGPTMAWVQEITEDFAEPAEEPGFRRTPSL
ncbi:acylphosphatase [Roseomonas marmotae]|uniref:acylphosphatase n=1 Tax=Roseomonas marmotae TaxID=2768161 RepID=A0ABS3K8Z8_9PROT|nr:acylphosphatase [Roseomonas marmotae]MBO1073400.1 acylphosphatase [Roseomonas marmotae]QTI80402.1 acylphosphatase [Roseomonas marmotae]